MDGDSPKQGEPGKRDAFSGFPSFMCARLSSVSELSIFNPKDREVQTVAEECPVAFLFYRDKNGKAEEGLRVRVSNWQTAREAMTRESRW